MKFIIILIGTIVRYCACDVSHLQIKTQSIDGGYIYNKPSKPFQDGPDILLPPQVTYLPPTTTLKPPTTEKPKNTYIPPRQHDGYVYEKPKQPFNDGPQITTTQKPTPIIVTYLPPSTTKNPLTTKKPRDTYIPPPKPSHDGYFYDKPKKPFKPEIVKDVILTTTTTTTPKPTKTYIPPKEPKPSKGGYVYDKPQKPFIIEDVELNYLPPTTTTTTKKPIVIIADISSNYLPPTTTTTTTTTRRPTTAYLPPSVKPTKNGYVYEKPQNQFLFEEIKTTYLPPSTSKPVIVTTTKPPVIYLPPSTTEKVQVIYLPPSSDDSQGYQYQHPVIPFRF